MDWGHFSQILTLFNQPWANVLNLTQVKYSGMGITYLKADMVNSWFSFVLTGLVPALKLFAIPLACSMIMLAANVNATICHRTTLVIGDNRLNGRPMETDVCCGLWRPLGSIEAANQSLQSLNCYIKRLFPSLALCTGLLWTVFLLHYIHSSPYVYINVLLRLLMLT